jgi:uncharacterized coiled-coil protein SlyX
MDSGKLTFSQFKDWAFLTVSVALVGMLVKSIDKLDVSVQLLSQKLSETANMITILKKDVEALEKRVDRLEVRQAR